MTLMRVARCSAEGDVFWAIVDGNEHALRRIEGEFSSWAPTLTRERHGEHLQFSDKAIALEKVRLLPPVEKVSKIEVVGANYSRHLKELDIEESTQPVIFLKAYGALIGANDQLRYPPATSQLDYEVELVVVI